MKETVSDDQGHIATIESRIPDVPLGTAQGIKERSLNLSEKESSLQPRSWLRVAFVLRSELPNLSGFFLSQMEM
jgi:hypothetical protein